MAQEGRKAHPRGAESSDGYEGGLGLGKPLGEVGGCRDCRRKPVSQPADLGFGGKNRAIQVHRGE